LFQFSEGARKKIDSSLREGDARERRVEHGVAFPRLTKEDIMGFGRGALLWLLGVPLPIILLLALFMHH
jgi:hypothetical protein